MAFLGLEGNVEFEENQAGSSDPAESLVLVERGLVLIALVVVDSDDELVKKAAATAGSVGLVDVYGINSSVEVIKVGGKLPLEPGYPLRGS